MKKKRCRLGESGWCHAHSKSAIVSNNYCEDGGPAITDKMRLDWLQSNKHDFGFDADGKAWTYPGIYVGMVRRRTLRPAIDAAIRASRKPRARREKI